MIKVLKFSTPWCGNCKALAPIIEEVTKELDIELVEIQADKDIETCEKYNVINVPMLVIEKDGKFVQSVQGLVSKASIEQTLKNLLDNK